MGEIASVTFNEANIETFDKTGETKINLAEIDKIVETGEYIYLRSNAVGSLIIPKLKVENVDKLRGELKELSNKLKIEFISELNWKWK